MVEIRGKQWRRVVRNLSSIICYLIPLLIAAKAEPFSFAGNPSDPSKGLSGKLSGLNWIEKVSRYTRGGQTLGRNDPLDRWKKLQPEKLVDEFIAHPLFAESALQFALYFYGQNPQKIYSLSSRQRFLSSVYWVPSVVAAARSIHFDDGRFLDLIDLDLPKFYSEALNPPQLPEGLNETGAPLDDQEARKRLHQDYQDTFKRLFKNITHESPKKEFCDLYRNNISLFNPTNYIYQLGYSSYWIFTFFETISSASFACSDDGEYSNPVAIIDELKNFYSTVYRYSIALGAPSYRVESLGDLIEVSHRDFNTTALYRAFAGYNFWRHLTNTSTNSNRKRAEFFLNRFFCEDLIPIPLAEMATTRSHAPKGSHVSDPQCRACHYRLDPMAGFFRSRGILGSSYDKYKKIVFDDSARLNREEYFNQWRDASIPGGWNVGYIRSDRQRELNNYGSTESDLIQIIKTAPEVRACIAKRAIKFVLGEDVDVDWGFQQELVQNFMDQAQSNATEAFKKLYRRLLLSNAFATKDPRAGKCYDYGSKPPGRAAPPCSVAAILGKNCVQCHGSSRQSGNLRLDQWSEQNGFIYLDQSGKQIPKNIGIQKILARVKVTDPEERMPPQGKHLPVADRDRLFIWLQQGAGNE